MSTITIKNVSEEAVRVAIFAKPTRQPTLATIAWQVVAPPPQGGQTIIQIPSEYQVYANYSDHPAERDNPNAGNRTNIISFSETTARFEVKNVASTDTKVDSALIEQSFNDLVLNEVRVVNNFSTGVWAHISRGGNDLYAPQVVWPGGVLLEDIRSSLYLAVVGEFVSTGTRLIEEEISLTCYEIIEGGAATISGSKWNGYSIS